MPILKGGDPDINIANMNGTKLNQIQEELNTMHNI